MKIGVVMGGISSEYEVSLKTGNEIMRNLDSRKYEVHSVVINSKAELIDKIKGMDFAILALHGQYGEDGTIQGTLDTMGIPYTGCGLTASAVCLNKDLSKKLLRFEGVNTPDWLLVQGTDGIDHERIERLGWPVVVKPNSGGSSIGTQIVGSRDKLAPAVEEALKLDNEVIIEQYIKGDEITCSILNGELLPVLGIKPKAGFFDYGSKYDDGGAEEYVVELEENLYKKVEQTARKCYEALKCSVYARIDMIIGHNVPFVLEVNTLPGMTKNSLFPKSAKAAGIPFNKLLDLLIEYSLSNRFKSSLHQQK